MNTGATISRTLMAALLLLFLSGGVSGCGNTLYLVQVHRAEQSFQEAKELGAERVAPYQYYSAKLRLEKAKKEAAKAEYGNAADLSDEATDFSIQAIKIAKTQGAGTGNSR